MKPFNTKELNEGFQLDTSLLTPEQLSHVLQIFEARKIPISPKQSDNWSWLIYSQWAGEVSFYSTSAKPVQIEKDKWSSAYPIIDYATLCRGSVQLEPKTTTVCTIEVAKELMRYCEFINHGAEYAPREGGILFEYRCKGFTHDATKISPEDLERKLHGIYPVSAIAIGRLFAEEKVVVPESTQKLGNNPLSANNATTENPVVKDCLITETDKPSRYLRHKTVNGLIVEWHKNKKHGEFQATVIQQGASVWPVGDKSSRWVLESFEPCDYTPVFEFVKEDSPATEQPIRYTAEAIMQRILDKSKKLEQENAQLREEKINVIDLLNKSQIRIAELEGLIGNTDNSSEPVYDTKWLDKTIQQYSNDKYGLFLENHIVAVANLGSWAELDPLTSANIIVRAVAKHLNGGDCNEGWYICLKTDGQYEISLHSTSKFGIVNYKDKSTAQKAISILNSIDEQILKNYLQ